MTLGEGPSLAEPLHLLSSRFPTKGVVVSTKRHARVGYASAVISVVIWGVLWCSALLMGRGPV